MDFLEQNLTDQTTLYDISTVTTTLEFFTEESSWTSYDYTIKEQTNEEPVYDSLQDLKYLIPVTVLFTVIFITGLLGNLCTCIVIARNKFMHTPTNYYLFNLATSDLTMLILGLLPELYRNWIPINYEDYYDNTYICLIQRFVFEISLHATVLTVTGFSIDRYIAICHPFISLRLVKPSRIVKFIIAIWILASLLSVPQVFRMCVLCGIEDELVNEADLLLKHSSEIRSLVIFAIPMSLISVLYIIIAVKLRRSNKISSSKNSADQKKVVKMLVAVVISFFICWAPFHVHRIFAMYYNTTSWDEQIRLNDAYDIIFHTSGVFFYLSATINPLLYSIMSKKFRQAFKMTFGRGRRRHDSAFSDTRNKTISSVYMTQSSNSSVSENQSQIQVSAA